MKLNVIDELPNCTGWLASEKLDGVRAIWTGECFITRQGKMLKPPTWFTAKMPSVRLDGEIYMGRGRFNELQRAMQIKGGDWSGFEYHVFDLAELRTPIEARLQKLKSIKLPSHVKLVSHVVLSSNRELDEMEKAIVDGGGEGVVIRAAGSSYKGVFDYNMVKVKRLFPDLERWQG